ncbi:hypothetical protein KNE206_09060 [Kitasatospora sp. NE20-6]
MAPGTQTPQGDAVEQTNHCSQKTAPPEAGRRRAPSPATRRIYLRVPVAPDRLPGTTGRHARRIGD